MGLPGGGGGGSAAAAAAAPPRPPPVEARDAGCAAGALWQRSMGAEGGSSRAERGGGWWPFAEGPLGPGARWPALRLPLRRVDWVELETRGWWLSSCCARRERASWAVATMVLR